MDWSYDQIRRRLLQGLWKYICQLWQIDYDLCNCSSKYLVFIVDPLKSCQVTSSGTDKWYVLQETGVCKRDSGGPLACNGRLSGVVSFGIGCANTSLPDVYTNIQYYSEWIKSNMEPDTEHQTTPPSTGTASIVNIGAIGAIFIPFISMIWFGLSLANKEWNGC